MIDNSLIYEKYRKLLEEMLEFDDEVFDMCIVEGLKWDGYNRYDFSEVYSMDELDEICYGMSFRDFLDNIQNNHFSSDDDYFIWDSEGIRSLRDDEAKHNYYAKQTDISDLASYLIENYCYLDLHSIDTDLDEIVSTINNDEGLTDFELYEKYHKLYKKIWGDEE